jgi:hypothetical protein
MPPSAGRGLTALLLASQTCDDSGGIDGTVPMYDGSLGTARSAVLLPVGANAGIGCRRSS